MSHLGIGVALVALLAGLFVHPAFLFTAMAVVFVDLYFLSKEH